MTRFWDIPQPHMTTEQHAAYVALNEGIERERARPDFAQRQALGVYVVEAALASAYERAGLDSEYALPDVRDHAERATGDGYESEDRDVA